MNGVTPPDALPDAVAVLTADHRRVEACFEEFQCAKTMAREEQLAIDICKAVRVHNEVDQEIFYPAFLAATHDDYQHHMQLAEHQAIDELLAELEGSAPTDDTYFAKIHVLCELFSRHVKAEEKSKGIFAEVRQSKCNLVALGQAIAEGRERLMQTLEVGETAM